MLKKNKFIRLLLSLNLLLTLNLLAKNQDQAALKEKHTQTVKKIKPHKNKVSVKEITSEQELLNLRPAIVEFYRPGCAACKMFKKNYEELAKNYPQINFLKINSEINIGLTHKYHIGSVPSFALIGSNDQVPFKILAGGHKVLLEKTIKELIDLERHPKK